MSNTNKQRRHLKKIDVDQWPTKERDEPKEDIDRVSPDEGPNRYMKMRDVGLSQHSPSRASQHITWTGLHVCYARRMCKIPYPNPKA